jgi:murein DD-endopeptidase MepM/ murein hydrolase activator NlpD
LELSLSRHHTELNHQRGGALFGAFLVTVGASVLVAGTVAFSQLTHTNPLSPSFIESEPPQIAWQEAPRGLGAEPAILTIKMQDSGAGLDEVIVRLLQNNKPTELMRRTFGAATVRDETIEVTVNPRELGLREGNAEVQVLAFDKSLWNNGAQLSKIVEINYLKPQITALTPQQNGVLGGSELVFYKVMGKRPDVQGVLSQGSVYPGFPASGWDSKFASKGPIYLAFYPLPPSFDESRETMELIARDALGNSAQARFNYRIKHRRWSSFKATFSEESARTMRESLLAYAQREKVPVKPSGDLASDLKMLLKALSLSDAGFIDTALSEPVAERLWREAFLPPVPSSPNNSAGDQRSVLVGNTEIVRGAATGVRFPVSKRTSVVAGNGGKVVFIGELGLLGNTIIIDHGFGLSTIYGHLSTVKVQRGLSVERGQEIGQTGTSGFAQSEEVYFEMRLHGQPVSPNEWWDQSWVTDHVENKVAFVLRDAA